jgi:hypothetical protein
LLLGEAYEYSIISFITFSFLKECIANFNRLRKKVIAIAMAIFASLTTVYFFIPYCFNLYKKELCGHKN